MTERKGDMAFGLPGFLEGIIPSVLLQSRKGGLERGPNQSEPSRPLVIQSPVRREFFGMEFGDFVWHQEFSLWKNKDRNRRLSEAFQALVFSLLKGDFKKALLHRKAIDKCCFPFPGRANNVVRLALLEASFYRGAMELPGLMENWNMDMARFFKSRSQRRSLAFFASGERRVARNKALSKVYGAFRDFRYRQAAYLSLPVLNCTVCATMGAGKSTFVNALLGRDVLPSRCEATTAKITSVYDRDGEKQILGFIETTDGQNGERTPDVSLKQLNAWNDDKGVRRIFLQGDFDGIANNGFVTAIHDTPGTNNSRDPSHHKTTIDFLTHNRMDLLIFVLNAEQLLITDEMSLLCQLFEKVVQPFGTPVLFVLNKADSCSSEWNEIDQEICEETKNLGQIGFKTPEILPVSSKAARLFKMVLARRFDKMTPDERQKDFPYYAWRYLQTPEGDHDPQNTIRTSPKTGAVEMDGKLYPSLLLKRGLDFTGITLIEKRIEELLSHVTGSRP